MPGSGSAGRTGGWFGAAALAEVGCGISDVPRSMDSGGLDPPVGLRPPDGSGRRVPPLVPTPGSGPPFTSVCGIFGSPLIPGRLIGARGSTRVEGEVEGVPPLLPGRLPPPVDPTGFGALAGASPAEPALPPPPRRALIIHGAPNNPAMPTASPSISGFPGSVAAPEVFEAIGSTIS